jgi:hypothetical protein
VQHEPNTPDAEKRAFEELMGTDSGRGISQMLTNHPTNFYDKIVKKIHVWYTPSSSDERYEMVLEL